MQTVDGWPHPSAARSRTDKFADTQRVDKSDRMVARQLPG